MRVLSTLVFVIILFSHCNEKPKKELFVAEESAVSDTFTVESDTLELIEAIKSERLPMKMYVRLEKELLYDSTYTLQDVYKYRDTFREFQFEKIKEKLAIMDSLRSLNHNLWGVLQNKKNWRGEAPLAKNYVLNKYEFETDQYGIERDQAIPLYHFSDLSEPERYNLDGVLVKVDYKMKKYSVVQPTNMDSIYLVPNKYINFQENKMTFNHVIVVDRKNQNISTYEKQDSIWYIRSMTPCTTGGNRHIYQRPTPLGLFVLQNKLPKMPYLKDGSDTELEGNAPWASRFCKGAYIHGVPIKLPKTEFVEYSRTLGTVPLSHMCVRNVTSHAQYIYNTFPTLNSFVFVIE